MGLLAAFYWRDAELAGLQFTANRFRQREIRPHRHGGYTLSVSDTELEIRTSAGTTVVAPNTLVRIAPRVWHSLRARATPWSERAMYCSGAVARCVNAVAHIDIDGMLRAEEGAVVVLNNPQAARDFVECHDLLRDALKAGDAQCATAGRTLLRHRLWQWLANEPLSVVGAVATAGTRAQVDERMSRLYELIATDFHQRITLDALARTVGWHPVHVQKRFKTVWGFTPHELLVGHRIEYARDLIAGGARVGYAAHAAGFSDQSHLHRTFMGTYAVVPGEYRRLSGLDALQPVSARNGIVD